MTLRVLTVSQIQRLDGFTITRIGIPSIVLMENAGRLVAEEALRYLRKKSRVVQTVSVVCGTGNNGGDGLVCARYLLNQSVKAKIFLIGNPQDLKADCATNYQILRNLKVPVYRIDSRSSIKKDLRESSLVIDAIFGVGSNREIIDPFKTIIKAINERNVLLSPSMSLRDWTRRPVKFMESVSGRRRP